MEITIHSPLTFCIICDCNININNNNLNINNNNNNNINNFNKINNNNNNLNNNNNINNNLIKTNNYNNFNNFNNVNYIYNRSNINNNRILIFNIKTRDLIYLYQPNIPSISYPLPWPKHRPSIKYLNNKISVLSLCDKQNHSSLKGKEKGVERVLYKLLLNYYRFSIILVIFLLFGHFFKN